MNEITLIGIDLAKNIFRINCLNENGKRVINRSLHRESLIQFLAPLKDIAPDLRLPDGRNGLSTDSYR